MGAVEDTRFAALEARLAALEAWRAGGAAPSGGPAPSPGRGGGEVADDRDLDGEWGNPEARKMPARWNGPDYTGCRFSECPSDLLRMMAEFFDWQGDKDEAAGKTHKGKPTAPYRRKDAARARGWARRNEGKQPATPRPPAAAPMSENGEYVDPEIPF